MTIQTTDRHPLQPTEARQPATTLLVGFDGSEEAQAALASALDRVGPGDALYVVHAYSKVADWMGYPYYGQQVRQAQEDARHVLDQAAAIANESPAEVTLEMHEGAPAEVLTRIAQVREVDEIVVGTRGLGRIRAALGSVTQELSRTADRPVLIVPAGTAQPA